MRFFIGITHDEDGPNDRNDKSKEAQNYVCHLGTISTIEVVELDKRGPASRQKLISPNLIKVVYWPFRYVSEKNRNFILGVFESFYSFMEDKQQNEPSQINQIDDDDWIISTSKIYVGVILLEDIRGRVNKALPKPLILNISCMRICKEVKILNSFETPHRCFEGGWQKVRRNINMQKKNL